MEGFVGRGKELAELREMLDNPDLQALAILGKKRVGKTSLLNELSENHRRFYIQFIDGSTELNLTVIPTENRSWNPQT